MDSIEFRQFVPNSILYYVCVYYIILTDCFVMYVHRQCNMLVIRMFVTG